MANNYKLMKVSPEFHALLKKSEETGLQMMDLTRIAARASELPSFKINIDLKLRNGRKKKFDAVNEKNLLDVFK